MFCLKRRYLKIHSMVYYHVPIYKDYFGAYPSFGQSHMFVFCFKLGLEFSVVPANFLHLKSIWECPEMGTSQSAIVLQK